MDALVEFLPLLFVAAYYLLAARRKSAQRRQAAQRQNAPPPEIRTAPPSEPKAPSPFESFLVQLEEAMAEANGVQTDPEPEESLAPLPEPEPLVIVPPAPIVPRPTVSLGTEFSPSIGSFDSLAPVDHEAHGFGEDNPYSEEVFERVGQRTGPRPSYDPHKLRPRNVASPRPASMTQRLSDPRTARDAFVLQTIFGPRGGRKGDRR